MSSSSSATRLCRQVGIAFDIDGVLIRGSRVLPRAVDAIRKVREAQMPHIFLTNGGGVHEERKAAQLSQWLDCDVSPDQVVLSHTPMQPLADRFRNQTVLVVGTEDVAAVAKSYGFDQVVSVSSLVRHSPDLYPGISYFKDDSFSAGECDRRALDVTDPSQIKAVLVMHDGVCWGAEVQVIVDCLMYGGEPGQQQTPIWFSNPDLLWAADYQHPRLGQGALQLCVRSVYEALTGRELVANQLGKPTSATYRFAESVLKSQHRDIEQFVGIGDNPLADIRGANNAGWESILVRTGVFDGADNDCHDPATFVVPDVYDAVELVLDKHS